MAYLEFVRGEDGSVTKIGPRNEKEELKAQDQWLVCVRLFRASFACAHERFQAKRENEIAKIRLGLEKEIHQLEKIAERLHAIAGSRFQAKYKPHGECQALQVVRLTGCLMILP